VIGKVGIEPAPKAEQLVKITIGESRQRIYPLIRQTFDQVGDPFVRTVNVVGAVA
jgi:hypothetical protein